MGFHVEGMGNEKEKKRKGERKRSEKKEMKRKCAEPPPGGGIPNACFLLGEYQGCVNIRERAKK